MIGAGYLPEVGPEHRLQQPHVLLGLLACAGDHLAARCAAAASSIKHRAPTVEEAWITCIRLALICVVVFGATLLLRLRPRRHELPGLRASSSSPWSCSTAFIASKTIIGRHIYAVGGNRHAAELSGVQAASGSTSSS